MGLTGSKPVHSIQETSEKSLYSAYKDLIKNEDLAVDPHQLKILNELQSVYNHLLTNSVSLQQNSFASLFIRPKIKEQKTIGLYIWGGVGRGKTFLVDFFYDQLPINRKMRLHFHRFMQLVHEELKTLEGISNPLHTVAKNLSKKTRLLCLDELHVIDITDAMLLARLFEYLFDLGVVLVTTSNFHPDELYKNGLQRERFLPAIDLLKRNTTVIEMTGEVDYRSKTLQEIGNYYLSSNPQSDQKLEQHFHKLSGVELHQDRIDVIINNRHIPVKMWSANVVWFSFDNICNTHRSTKDYIQIATFFNTVLISNIPVMDNSMDDAARRFINMIDTFYDMHINLVVSADAEPEGLYVSTKLSFEFQRTTSRINEMQTQKYIQGTSFNKQH